MVKGFEDTTYGVIEATAVANFKMWSLKQEELEGFQPITLYNLLPFPNISLILYKPAYY